MKALSLLLFAALTKFPLLTSAASSPQQSGVERSIALLFENDGNWEKLADHTSALLFYDSETLSDAIQVCSEFGETLFKKEDLPDISNELSYLEFLGEFNKSAQFWISDSPSSSSGISITPFSSDASNLSSTQASAAQKHPFLCTNSAPLTTQVDTDFPSLPKTRVTTSTGTTFTGIRDHLTFRFQGIPFAAPPVGPLRFQYPQKWEGGEEVNATGYKPACLQFGDFANNDMGLNPWGISEDCLYLNVFTSYLPSASESSSSLPAPLRPVLLWIHGGGNVNGAGIDETFDGGPLVSREDVVIVTINYRLNIFGYLGFGNLSSSIPGNYAMADKIAALQWVQDHISSFGGDPNRVTIFGQSAGGWSIVDLVKSPKAKGVFQRAISQSGGDGTFSTGEQVLEMVEPFLSPLCNFTALGLGTELLYCLQALPADVLLNVTNFAGTWTTVQDGVYALAPTVDQVSMGPDAVNSVPFMLGFMPEEGESLLGTTISPNATDFNATLITAIGSSLAQDVLESGLWTITEDFDVYNATINAYTDFSLTCPAENMITAASQSNAFPAMYVYSMQHAYALSFFDAFDLCTFPVGHPQPYYRCHSGDLYEVFGTYHIFAQPIRIPSDVLYSNLVQDLWGSFARTGDPNPDLQDLAARGPAYASTLKLLNETKWVWPKYETATTQIASLQYPGVETVEGLPDSANGKCAVITAGSGGVGIQ